MPRRYKRPGHSRHIRFKPFFSPPILRPAAAGSDIHRAIIPTGSADIYAPSPPSSNSYCGMRRHP
ncbi:hypothetical protein BDR03DRAFT_1017143 [Suillus americanus]|nr:hypothetical protein BDR03DRAFT_1017143 [Suillus americanus]